MDKHDERAGEACTPTSWKAGSCRGRTSLTAGASPLASLLYTSPPARLPRLRTRLHSTPHVHLLRKKKIPKKPQKTQKKTPPTEPITQQHSPSPRFPSSPPIRRRRSGSQAVDPARQLLRPRTGVRGRAAAVVLPRGVQGGGGCADPPHPQEKGGGRLLLGAGREARVGVGVSLRVVLVGEERGEE